METSSSLAPNPSGHCSSFANLLTNLGSGRLIVLVVAFALLQTSDAVALAADPHFAGEVTIRGKTMAGRITLHLDDQFVGAKVKDGKFKVNRILVGKCRVTLEGKGVPAKYTSEDSTPLIIEVKEGANWHRFELE